MATPRLDPYDKLISRFYEHVFTLVALGQTRGKHTAVLHHTDVIMTTSTKLLDNLSYLLDYEKGGATSAAIGVEDGASCYTFWLACNNGSKLTTMKDMLEDIIRHVRDSISLPEDERDRMNSELIRRCVSFSIARVTKERQSLYRSIRKCNEKSLFIGSPSTADTGLGTWTQMFFGKDGVGLCILAYDQRNSNCMKEITQRGRERHGVYPLHAELYQNLRHSLGRLAHHVRAVKQVVEDASRLEYLFAEGTSRVSCITPVSSVPPPKPDGMTNLQGILKRMLPSQDPRLKEYEDALLMMDQKMGLRRILYEYSRPGFQPCVHAEVQVLDHFETNRLRFLGGNRIVGSSKPACLCCYLYFKAHPAKPVELRSHLKIWSKWGPQVLTGGTKDDRFSEQRKIMVTMMKSLSYEVLDQIRQKGMAPQWHADSTTGITPSVPFDTHSRAEVESQLARFTLSMSLQISSATISAC
ncbi:dim2-associated protein 1- variant 1 [Apiospora arundinis]